jgi:hypothetical protein
MRERGLELRSLLTLSALGGIIHLESVANKVPGTSAKAVCLNAEADL